MDKPITPVKPGMYKSALIPAAAVCYTFSALTGLASALLLLDSGYRQVLLDKLVLSGIVRQSAQNIWTVIIYSITLACALLPGIAAVGLWMVLRKKPSQGVSLLSTGAQGTLFAVHGSALLALGVIIYRVIQYLIVIAPRDDALYQLYAMVIMEGLMIIQAVFLYKLIVKFLNALLDTTASIDYTLATGKVDNCPTPALASTGFCLLGISNFVIAADRMFTLTIVRSFGGDYYKILTPAHWGQWASGATLILAGMGSLLLWRYLKKYKRISERALHEKRLKISV